jgi:hypothetical protein
MKLIKTSQGPRGRVIHMSRVTEDASCLGARKAVRSVKALEDQDFAEVPHNTLKDAPPLPCLAGAFWSGGPVWSIPYRRGT